MTARSQCPRRPTFVVGVSLLALVLGACKHDVYPQFDPPIPCRTSGPVSESVFLIGDAGDPELPDRNVEAPDALVDPVLRALASAVAKSVEERGADRTAVIVLGDNIYPAGLAPAGEKDHERGVRILEAQISAIGQARGFFTLGNHDWDQGAKRGWVRAKAQTDYLTTRAPNISVNPGQTCPGPEDVVFGDHLHFVFFDLWAVFHQLDYPGSQSHCTPRAGEGRVNKVLDRMLSDMGDRRAVLVAHPPMLTSGPHGGYFPWRAHVFPLRVFHRDLWIPLPLIGSLFPLARVLGVTDTDMMSSKYQLHVDETKQLFSPGHPTLVVAGHEHSLQVHLDPTGSFHAVSGAGSKSKVDYVREMRSDLMALAAPGFMRLDTYDDSTLRLNVTALDDDDVPRLVFSTCIP